MLSATHLHAMIVHFPIALIFAGFLSEIIALFTKKEFFRQAAFYLLLLGTAGAVAAYLSGENAGEGIEEGPLEGPMDLHEDAALITMWLSVGLAAFRVAIQYFKLNHGWTKLVSIVAFAALIGSVSYTGYLGGQLVYSHGAGVQLVMPGVNAGDGGGGEAEADE